MTNVITVVAATLVAVVVMDVVMDAVMVVPGVEAPLSGRIIGRWSLRPAGSKSIGSARPLLPRGA